jgi:putative hydrolase of the HAD superfamily
MNPPVTAVFFDALGTLYEPAPPQTIFSHVMTGLGRELGESDAARLLRRANRWWLDPARQPARTAEEELAERRTYVALFLEEYGEARDGALAERLEEEAYWARWARPFPDAAPVLEELRPRYRLAVLSNGGPSSLDAIRHSGLAGYFDAMYAGLELGAQKPEARAYSLAAQELGVPLDSSWLVDDTAENVVGGMTAGMEVVYLDRGGQGAKSGTRVIRTLHELPGLLRAHTH